MAYRLATQPTISVRRISWESNQLRHKSEFDVVFTLPCRLATDARSRRGYLGLLATGLAALSILTSGCASFHPQPVDKVGFEQRAQSGSDGQVTVTVVALTEEDARGVLGVNVAGNGIQPLWVKVENHEEIGFVIAPIVIDHEYFTPMEAAWQAHGWLSTGTNARIDEHFRARHLPARVGPGATVSGFVFTNLDKGDKYVTVELIGSGSEQVRRFAFLAKVPDLNTDALPLSGKSLYSTEEIQSLDETAFRA